MKRAIRVLLVLLVIGAAAAWYLSRMAATVSLLPAYETITVGQGTITQEVSGTGTVTLDRSLALTFRSMGVVSEILVQPGDLVEEGQPLARLDSRDLELQLQLAQTALQVAETQRDRGTEETAESDINAARAAVASAQAAYQRALEGPNADQAVAAQVQLEKAQIAVQHAQAAYDEIKWIGAISAMPQSLQLQAATLDLEAAQANYNQATRGASQADLSALMAQVIQAQSQLDRLLRGAGAADRALLDLQVEQARISVQQAQNQLDYTTLTAPFSGQVSTVNLEVGQSTAAGLAAITLIDPTSQYILVRIDESDIGRVAVGQVAEIEPESFGNLSLAGHVTEIALTQAGAGLSAASPVVQYEVKLQLDEPFERLRPGMTVQVYIEVEHREGVTVVPNRVVNLDQGTGVRYVLRMVDGVPVRSEVMLGARGDGVTEVLAGLEPGDTAVIPSDTGLEEFMISFGGG